MIKRIQEALNKNKAISDYKILETKDVSLESFYTKKTASMKRTKATDEYEVFVYVDKDVNGKLMRGDASVFVYVSMSDAEIKEVIDRAVISASKALNPHFMLPVKQDAKLKISKSSFGEGEMHSWLNTLEEEFYRNDKETSGGINSLEIFLVRKKQRLVNSKGVDVESENAYLFSEYVLDWKEAGKEEIELYFSLTNAEFRKNYLADLVAKEIINTRDRLHAIPTPSLSGVPILFSASDDIESLFNYYIQNMAAAAVYFKRSNVKLGEMFPGQKMEKDTVTISTVPDLESSTFRSAYDADGVALTSYTMIKEGKAVDLVGSNQFCQYLNLPPKGIHTNFSVEGGSYTEAELRSKPYLEPIKFSDFYVSPQTGEFGAEIRLAYYFDGTKKIPVSGGSISGSLSECQKNFQFSKNTLSVNHLRAPEFVLLHGASIAGCAD